MRLSVGLLFVAFAGQPLLAQDLTFVQCGDTGQHIAVQRNRDHYVVHFHLRVQTHQGKSFFGRIRAQYPDGNGALATVAQSSIVKAQTNNDLWSMYFRVPVISDLSRRRKAIYQVEIGIYDSLALNDFAVTDSFGWRITADDNGRERVTTGEGAAIPLNIRIAHIEGNRVVIRYGYGAPVPVRSIKCSIVTNLELGNIPGERAVKRIN